MSTSLQQEDNIEKLILPGEINSIKKPPLKDIETEVSKIKYQHVQ